MAKLQFASGPWNSTKRWAAIAVTSASGTAKSIAYSRPFSIEIRPISTAAITNMAMMKWRRLSYWPW